MIEKKGNFLMLSLFQLKKGTACALKNEVFSSIWCHSYKKGLFISVPEPSSNEWYPDDLDAVFYFARHTDVSLIWLDEDITIDSKFKTYFKTWEDDDWDDEDWDDDEDED